MRMEIVRVGQRQFLRLGQAGMVALDRVRSLDFSEPGSTRVVTDDPGEDHWVFSGGVESVVERESVACIAVVPRGGGLLAIRCSKGRGTIMPGGKWDGPPETYRETALRELEEETGLSGGRAEFVAGLPDGFGYHVMAFLVTGESGRLADRGSGEPVVADWAELLRSQYGAYYDLLREVLGR